MISESDGILVERFTRSGDAEAFATLAKRYAPMVYATALRVTGNASDAEDVSQDCFLSLARQASVIRSSVPAWLHRQAVGRAVDHVRKIARQGKRERAAAITNGGAKADPTWDEIAPYVDEALLQLTDELREPVILHYLQGLTQEQVAEKCGISQPTVHRRLEKGVTALRASMRKAGFVVSAAVLVSFLSTGTAHAAPAGLMAVLGKLAISGIGGPGGAGAAAAATGTAITAGGIGMKIAAAVVVGATVIGVAAYTQAGPAKEQAPERAPAIVETAPVVMDTPDEPTTPPVQEQLGREEMIKFIRSKARWPIYEVGPSEALRGRTDDELRSVVQFIEAYSLKPDEHLKLIPEPFMPGRLVFYELSSSYQAHAIPSGPDHYFLRWDSEGWLQWNMSFSQGQLFSNLIVEPLSLPGSTYVLGDEGPMTMTWSGDFVWREASTQEERVAGLQKALRDMRWPVRVELRDVERDVFIAEGAYTPKALPDYRNDVVIYGTQMRANPDSGGGGRVNLGTFFGHVGSFVGYPIIAGEVVGAPKSISYLDGPRARSADGNRRRELPMEEVNLVLQHLTEQTGLTFHMERRPVRTLFIEEMPLEPVVRGSEETTAPAYAK